MALLTIYRGLPGSGKTHHARAVLARAAYLHQRGNVHRINRDDYRAMALDANYRAPAGPVEDMVTVATHAAIRALLTAQIDVLCDDTNLDDRHVIPLMVLARATGAAHRFLDLTQVPLEICLRRDARRERRVGEGVICTMHRKYVAPLHGKPMPVPQLPAQYQVWD